MRNPWTIIGWILVLVLSLSLLLVGGCVASVVYVGSKIDSPLISTTTPTIPWRCYQYQNPEYFPECNP